MNDIPNNLRIPSLEFNPHGWNEDKIKLYDDHEENTCAIH